MPVVSKTHLKLKDRSKEEADPSLRLVRPDHLTTHYSLATDSQ